MVPGIVAFLMIVFSGMVWVVSDRRELRLDREHAICASLTESPKTRWDLWGALRDNDKLKLDKPEELASLLADMCERRLIREVPSGDESVPLCYGVVLSPHEILPQTVP